MLLGGLFLSAGYVSLAHGDSNPKGNEFGFWCRDPREGENPNIVMPLEGDKRSIIVCGSQETRDSSQLVMSEFFVWEVPKSNRVIPRKHIPPTSPEEAAAYARKHALGQMKPPILKKKDDSIKELMFASAIDFYSLRLMPEKGVMSFETLAELPAKGNSPVLTPYKRELLKCSITGPCAFSKPVCALPKDLPALSEEEVIQFENEISKDLLFLDDPRELRFAQLLGSALKGNKRARKLLDKLAIDPRRDGHLAEQIDRAVRKVAEAAEAGCPGLE